MSRKSIDLSTPEGRKLFYNSPEWKAIRSIVLIANPYCMECLKEGIHEIAVDVDYIIDIKDAPTRCMDITNLQGLCHKHHSQKTCAGSNSPFGKNAEYITVNKKWN